MTLVSNSESCFVDEHFITSWVQCVAHRIPIGVKHSHVDAVINGIAVVLPSTLPYHDKVAVRIHRNTGVILKVGQLLVDSDCVS